MIDNQEEQYNASTLCSLHSLFEDEHLTDVELQTGDGEFVRAHKVVLAAASPFFRAMFVGTGQSMKEKSQPITLSGINSPALRCLLEAIYKDTDDVISFHNVEALMASSTYLSVPKIINSCCNFLSTSLNNSNAVYTLTLAQQYDAAALEQEAMHYIQRHYRALVRSSDLHTLQDLSLPSLLHIISSDALEVAQEADVIKGIIVWLVGDVSTRLEHLELLLTAIRAPLTVTECNTIASEAIQDLDQHTALSSSDWNSLLAAIQTAVAHSSLNRTASTFAPRHGTPTGLMAAGGLDEGWRSLKTVELYDPRTDTWRPGRSMPSSCSFAAACTIGHISYVVEGSTHSSAVLAYDRSREQQSWKRVASPNTSRVNMAVAGDASTGLHVLGGRSETAGRSKEMLRGMERYDPVSNTWASVSSMNIPRSSLGAAALEGTVYAIGGQSQRTTHSSVELYNCATDTWSDNGRMDMNQARKYLAVTAAPAPHLIFAVGGMTASRSRLATVEALDPRQGRWQILPSMCVARSSCGVAVLGNELFVVGGNVVSQGEGGDGSAHQGVECYSLTAGKWRSVAPLATRRSGLSVCAV